MKPKNSISHLFQQLQCILSRRTMMGNLSQLRWTASRPNTLPFSCLVARSSSCLQTAPCSPLLFCCWPSRSLFLHLPLMRLCWHIAQGTFILMQPIKSFICQRQSFNTWDISSLLFCSPWPTQHQVIRQIVTEGSPETLLCCGFVTILQYSITNKLWQASLKAQSMEKPLKTI